MDNYALINDKLLSITGIDNLILYDNNIIIPIHNTEKSSCLECCFCDEADQQCVLGKYVDNPCNPYVNKLGIPLIFKISNIDTTDLDSNIDTFILKKI